MKKIATLISLGIVVSGCATSQNQTEYRLVNDDNYIKKVEAVSQSTGDANKIIWVNPPKKKVPVKDDNK